MELQIIKTEGYVKKESCNQESLFTVNNDTLVECIRNSQKTVTVPEGIKVIGRECFAQTDVEEVILPEGIEVIGTDAFAFCRKLKKINFPETLNVVSDGAFKECSSLETVVLPKKMKELDN